MISVTVTQNTNLKQIINMDTFKKIEVVKELVSKYLKENGKHAGLSEEDCYIHIVEIGTSILCTKWQVRYAGGGFVQAVVDNDLQRAFAYADSTNLKALKFYCQLMYNVGIPYFGDEPLGEIEQFIKDISEDYQFDASHPEYCGFLNINPSEHVMGLFFVKNWRKYVSLMAHYGIKLESAPNEDEAVFITLQ